MPEIYSYGHRNAQGLAIHPETNELWLSEMGPRGGDELNLIEAGKNYGWAVITYGLEYSGNRWAKASPKKKEWNSRFIIGIRCFLQAE
jgi:glucose/arabinose dehydrogenase